MDSLPIELRESVRPLVFIQGEHHSFTSSLASCLTAVNIQPPAALYRCVSSYTDLNLPVKSASKSQSDGVEYGILKKHWVAKYATAVPSAVVHCASFNIAQGLDWDLREYRGLRTAVDAHEATVIVVAVVVGAEQLDGDTVEDCCRRS
jgi:hypothetical protein